MIKIYDIEKWPNPMRVRVAVQFKGLADQVEYIPVDVMGLEHRSDAFLAKNPDGKIPMMELETGQCISSCNAIIEYLDHQDGSPTLTGQNAEQRAEISMWNTRAEAGLLDAVGDYFHHATPGLGEKIETFQCPPWGEQRKLTALKTMALMDTRLADSPFLAGSSFSEADITAFAGLRFADIAKIAIPDELNALSRWHAEISALPYFQGQ